MVVQAVLPRDSVEVAEVFRRRPGCQADQSGLESGLEVEDFPTNNQLLVRKPSLGWLLRVDSAFVFPPSLMRPGVWVGAESTSCFKGTDLPPCLWKSLWRKSVLTHLSFCYVWGYSKMHTCVAFITPLNFPSRPIPPPSRKHGREQDADASHLPVR